MPSGDVTTNSILPDTAQATAEIQAVEKLTFAGAEIVPHCFGSSCRIHMDKSDKHLFKFLIIKI